MQALTGGTFPRGRFVLPEGEHITLYLICSCLATGLIALSKAWQSGADAVSLDLEDAV